MGIFFAIAASSEFWHTFDLATLSLHCKVEQKKWGHESSSSRKEWIKIPSLSNMNALNWSMQDGIVAIGTNKFWFPQECLQSCSPIF